MIKGFLDLRGQIPEVGSNRSALSSFSVRSAKTTKQESIDLLLRWNQSPASSKIGTSFIAHRSWCHRFRQGKAGKDEEASTAPRSSVFIAVTNRRLQTDSGKLHVRISSPTSSSSQTRPQKFLSTQKSVDLDNDNDKGFEVLIHLNSFESKSGPMEEAGTNGRSPVDKWKCQGQMDKSNHSKPTRVVGRGRDNFDSIVPVLIQFFMQVTLVVFHTFKNSVYGGPKNLMEHLIIIRTQPRAINHLSIPRRGGQPNSAIIVYNVPQEYGHSHGD
ncbi:hypothetical protein LXL04_019384 [Taraxacum kok-saghyz]